MYQGWYLFITQYNCISRGREAQLSPGKHARISVLPKNFAGGYSSGSIQIPFCQTQLMCFYLIHRGLELPLNQTNLTNTLLLFTKQLWNITGAIRNGILMGFSQDSFWQKISNSRLQVQISLDICPGLLGAVPKCLTTTRYRGEWICFFWLRRLSLGRGGAGNWWAPEIVSEAESFPGLTLPTSGAEIFLGCGFSFAACS